MGNHSCKSLSCTAITTATIFPVITILNGSTATISELPPPLTAAEVMMEHPGHFISCYNSNPNPNPNSGSRHLCSAVPADHELGTKDVYLLLPMNKLNSRLSEQETTFINTILHSRRAAKLASGAKSSDKSGGSARRRNKFYRRSSSSCGNDNNGCGANVAAVSLSKVAPMPRLVTNLAAALEISQEEELINEELADQFSQLPSSLRHLQSPIMMCRSKSWIPKLETISELAY